MASFAAIASVIWIFRDDLRHRYQAADTQLGAYLDADSLQYAAQDELSSLAADSLRQNIVLPVDTDTIRYIPVTAKQTADGRKDLKIKPEDTLLIIPVTAKENTEGVKDLKIKPEDTLLIIPVEAKQDSAGNRDLFRQGKEEVHIYDEEVKPWYLTWQELQDLWFLFLDLLKNR